jgi:signal transduction histidine kinase/ligand-binding sensor domain-containing protein
MKKYLHTYFSPVGFLFCLLVLHACNSYPDTVPFPENENEFQKPLTEKISYSAGTELKWIDVNADSLYTSRQRTFNLDKIPAKPFIGFNKHPLLKPMQMHKFNADKLKDTFINLDKIPANKLKFKTSILGQPAIYKTGFPRLKDGASESLLMFGQDQGLTTTVITDFSQDKEGALWIASDDGINRFDGEYIESYTRQQGFSDDFKFKILADSKGQVWCTQNKSFNTIEIIDQMTKTMKHIGVSEGLSSMYISGIMEDRKGRIWLSSVNGLNLLDEKKGTIQIINKENGLSDNVILCMLQDQEGNIWFGTNENGIDILDEKSGKIRHVDSSTGLLSNKITALSQNEKGEVWVGTDSGIEIIQLKEGNLLHFNASNGLNTARTISGISFDKLGHTWISTRGAGVEVYNPNDQTIKHLNVEQGLSNDIIIKVFADSRGQIWMGTFAGEINIYNPLAGNLQHLTSAQGLNNKSEWIFALSEDARGKKWIGSTGEGIDIIDEKKATIQHLYENEGLNSRSIVRIFSDSKGRTWVSTHAGMNMIDEISGTIKSWNSGYSVDIMEDSKGSVWFSNEEILVYDVAKNSFKKVNKEHGLNSNHAGYILEDGSGQIWVSTEFGLSVIDSSKKTIKTIENKFLKNIDIYKIIQDSRGLIWMGTYGNGVMMLDLKAGLVTQFSVKEGLSDRLVLSVVEKEGKIYAGTNNGISVFSPKEQNTRSDKKENDQISWDIKNYGKPQGLARVDHNPSSMLTKDGRLWWGFAHVLTIMDEPKEDKISPVAKINGIDIMGKPRNFVNRNWLQSTINFTDTVWTVSMDSFYLFQDLPPDSGYLKENNITWDSLSMSGLPLGLTLPYHQNHLSFRFTGMQLANLNQTRYSFILEGIEKEWNSISDKTFVDYRNLSPGNYTFKVSSRGFNGIWSQPAAFQFTILPPWWKSGWAYAFYGLCISVLVYMADKSQRRRLIFKEREKTREREFLQAKEIEKAYHELKTTQAQLIHSEKMASLGELTAGIAHEIQNPLNFVNNFSEINSELSGEILEAVSRGDLEQVKVIATDIKSNQEKIVEHGKRADSIVKGMLQHSRSSSGVKEPTDLNKLADEYLRLAFNGQRARDKTFNATLKTEFDAGLPYVPVMAQDIGYNNAFYAVSEKMNEAPIGYEPRVTVSTRLVPATENSLIRQSLPAGRKGANSVIISVKDNGNGIPQKILDKIFQPFFTTKPTGQGTGLGLSLSYDIVKAHGGELKVETMEGKGSEFIIQLPIRIEGI